MNKPYRVPTGWSKGEPLTVEKLSDTHFRLYRSGSYLATPDMPLRQGCVQYLDFPSRAAMNDFLMWWADPSVGCLPVAVAERHVQLTPCEYVELLEEFWCMNFSKWCHSTDASNVHPDLPNITFSVSMEDEMVAKALEGAHDAYIKIVKRILNYQPPTNE